MLTPDDLLDHANKAYQSNVSREAFARSGVSRAYYASYHYCLRAADKWCSILPKELREDAGNHERLIRRLKSQAKVDAAKCQLINLADMLGKARDLRVDADYHLERTVGADHYAKALRFGRAIKAEVEEIVRILTAQAAE